MAAAVAVVAGNAAAALLCTASNGDGHRGEEHLHGESRWHGEDNVSR